jgi:hypothetical protein
MRTTLFGMRTTSSSSVRVTYRSPSEWTVPCTSKPKPSNWTRSPTENGRALSSTMPAITLPIVCWAARPRMTAVNDAPSARAAGLRPAIRSATTITAVRAARRTRKPTTPAVPRSRRRSRIGPSARPRPRANAHPTITRTTTMAMTTPLPAPNSSVRKL